MGETPLVESLIAESSDYLASARARESLERDPYWPKWDSPWWHMTLLFELGRADAIPRAAAETMFAAIERHYVRFFPNPREPLATDKDARRHALCHCALGNMVQTLEACGVDVDARAPWMRAWFLHYQLPDGGLNCDERVYEKGGASSIQSTLPALEAVIWARRDLTPIEEEFLDRGAEYLIERRLAFRRGDGRPMSPSFLSVCFPRFYDYDILRGLFFLAKWSLVRARRVPRDAVVDAMAALSARFPDGRIRVERAGLAGERSLRLGSDGVWSRGETGNFALLELTCRVGVESSVLSRRWAEVRAVFGAQPVVG